jgi:hypothetical protein
MPTPNMKLAYGVTVRLSGVGSEVWLIIFCMVMVLRLSVSRIMLAKPMMTVARMAKDSMPPVRVRYSRSLLKRSIYEEEKKSESRMASLMKLNSLIKNFLL